MTPKPTASFPPEAEHPLYFQGTRVPHGAQLVRAWPRQLERAGRQADRVEGRQGGRQGRRMAGRMAGRRGRKEGPLPMTTAYWHRYSRTEGRKEVGRGLRLQLHLGPSNRPRAAADTPAACWEAAAVLVDGADASERVAGGPWAIRWLDVLIR